MPVCFGMAPGANGWHFAVLEAATTDGDWRHVDTQTGEPADPKVRGDFFAWCEDFVPRLEAGPPELACDETAMIRRLRDRLNLADVGAVYNDLKAQADYGEPVAVGICHPYAASPAVRCVLPVLFDGEPVFPPSYADYSTPPLHARTSEGARLCALENPLAGCLDLVSRRDGPPGADLLILTGSSSLAELTQVHVACEGDHVAVSVNATWTLAGGVGGRGLGDRWPASLGPTLAEGGSRCRLVVYGRHLRDVADAVVRAADLPGGRVLVEEESALAVGAARYAARCFARGLQGPEGEGGRLRVEHVVPRDVGLICTGRGGGAFWHRVFPANARLPADSVSIPVSGAVPSEVMLADRCDGSLGTCSWLEQGAWEGSLRWLASARTPSGEENRSGRLVFRLGNPSGRLEYGWSDHAAVALACPPQPGG